MVLRTVAYDNIAASPDTSARVVQFTATDGITPSNTATTTVTMQGRTKRISRYGGVCGSDLDIAPQALCEIEALLTAIPVSNGWVAAE